jgi:hypothetical protein
VATSEQALVLDVRDAMNQFQPTWLLNLLRGTLRVLKKAGDGKGLGMEHIAS